MVLKYPPIKNVGIWSREGQPDGLYQLTHYYAKKYKDFFNKQLCKNDYFNFCADVLYDRPNLTWLTNEMKNYGKILYFNCDNATIDEIKRYIKRPTKFLFYFADYPIDLHNFRKENDILKNKRIEDKFTVKKVFKNGKTRYPATGRRGMLYKTLLKLLHNHKYAHMKTHDFGLMMTLIGVGTIPILSEAPSEPFKLLKEGVHYLVAKKDDKPLSKRKYDIMRKNLNDFYEDYLHPDKTVRKLMNHLFIRDVK